MDAGIKPLKTITQSTTEVPDLRVYRESVDAKRLRDVISGVCRPGGFSLDGLGEYCDFDIRRSKSRYRFPPHPVFEYLGSKEGDNFVLGLKKTDKDPDGGFNHCYYIQYDTGSTPSNTESAWASFQVKDNKLIVNCVQSETVMDSDREKVAAEMQGREKELTGPQTGKMQQRINSLKAHNVPWAYPDRALLFGAVAVVIAQQMGLKEVKFVEDSQSRLAARTYEYTRDRIRHPGIEVTKGLPEIF